MSDELLKRAAAYPHDVRRKPMSIAESIALVNDLAARVRELEADDAYVALKRNNDDLRERAERAEAERDAIKDWHRGMIGTADRQIADLRADNERLRALLRACHAHVGDRALWYAISAALAKGEKL